ITDRLEQGIAELFDSERYKEYLKVMSKFHNYSFRNTVLIAMQKPDASLVAGFSAWKNNFERNVMKGQKGIKIIAPSPYKIKQEMQKIDPHTQKPIIGKDGKPVTEEKEITIPAYKVVSVFDVSQTEGKELPDIAVDELTGDVDRYKDFFAALEKTSPVPIAFENIEGGSHGYYHLEDKRIAINEGMSELQTLKTAIHEIAHAKLHDIDLNAPKDEQQSHVDRRTREVEAESVAYTVCQHYGLDTSDYSFGYVAGWSSGRELAELKSSLEIIKSTAAKLIEAIDGHFAEIQKEQAKGQAQAQPEAVTEPPEPPAPEQPEAAPQKQADTAQETRSETPQETATTQETQQAAAPYYSINETAARRAKDMNSFYDYKPGSATAEYRSYIDEAVQIAERQKKRVDPMYHEKIDSLLDTYARKLAANMNKGYEIAGRVPSILIAGGSNFPTRKKEKQNAATDRNMQEYRDIQGLLDKIRSTGMGGISADDPQAVEKLQKKLAGLEKSQETMKAVNAYYRKHKTLDGCPHLPPEQLEKLKADMSSQWHLGDKPFASWALSNNNAEIRRVKDRIKSLSQTKEIGFVGWEFEGGRVEANTEANRLQIFFDGKPDEATRTELKSNGFRWSPKAEAWQRQLTNNAYYAADYVKSIQPLTGEKPTDLLRAHIRGQKEAAQAQPPQEYIYQVHANPRSDSRENLSILQAYVPQEDGKAKIGDVLYIGTPEKCRELMGQLNAGELTQAEVKELYAKAQETAQTAGQDKDTFSIY
ncbi:MAG: ArdC-like ssDNA-binding domain-containing protein, partial [Lachnospiraceae bacterium]|nr:ArdC-like ssDNA-binding domain-containing protein [Lachnospiraceae bacterium]